MPALLLLANQIFASPAPSQGNLASRRPTRQPTSMVIVLGDEPRLDTDQGSAREWVTRDRHPTPRRRHGKLAKPEPEWRRR